jgi:hypothetical protein
MAKTDLKSVDEYIASQPEAVRGAIRNAVPGACGAGRRQDRLPHDRSSRMQRTSSSCLSPVERG